VSGCAGEKEEGGGRREERGGAGQVPKPRVSPGREVENEEGKGRRGVM